MTERTPIVPIAATCCVLLTSLTLLAYLGRSPSEQVRVRNSWILRVGKLDEFDWAPAQAPRTFQAESAAPPPQFVSLAAAHGRQGDDVASAIGLAAYLGQFVTTRPGPIQRSVSETLRAMQTRGSGYCSDISQVFTGLSLAAGLWVREWSIFFGEFGGDAHVFDEIFDRQHDKWVMVDPLYAFVPVDARSGEPLSFLEFREALKNGREDEMEIRWVGRPRPVAEVFDYYRPGIDRVALTWGNAKFSRERGAIARILDPRSVEAAQAARILIGDFPEIVAYPTAAAEASASRLRALSRVSIGAIVVGAAAFVLLALQLTLLAWRRREPGGAQGEGTAHHAARATYRPSPTRTERSSSRPNSG